MNISKIIDGKAAAATIIAQVKQTVFELRAKQIKPCLAVILVGEDPASHVYVRNKILRAEETGIVSEVHRVPADTREDQLLELIETLNADQAVHGILLQLPLPEHIQTIRVIEAIDPRKDVDGFHSENVGGLSQGRDALAPCTPTGCMLLLRALLGDLSGKHAVVIGRSNIVGKPMAALLLRANCSVTIVHSRSENPQALSRQADIVIAAVGRPRLVDTNWLKPGAIVIDVGINRIEEAGHARLVGDVDFDRVLPSVSAITPVPGGVGPMTIACLMQNTVLAAQRQTLAKRPQEAVCPTIS